MISQKAVAGLSRLVERGWLELQMFAKCCVYCVSQYWRQSGESKPSAGQMRPRHGGPPWLALWSLCMHSVCSPSSSSLVVSASVFPILRLALACGRVLKYVDTTGGSEEETAEPLNLTHSIICTLAVLSHWELLNTLDGNASVSDRHKYQVK